MADTTKSQNDQNLFDEFNFFFAQNGYEKILYPSNMNRPEELEAIIEKQIKEKQQKQAESTVYYP